MAGARKGLDLGGTGRGCPPGWERELFPWPVRAPARRLLWAVLAGLGLLLWAIAAVGTRGLG